MRFLSCMSMPSNRLVLYMVLFLIWLSPLYVLWDVGWPYNHEYLAFVTRTQLYATHFAHGDFLPLWSSLDNFGLGSPQPIFYHKLFYYFSGLCLWVFGAVKVSLILPLLLFLAVGMLGTYVCVYHYTNKKNMAILSAICFALANYTVTNWLIRGALAEFSAAMLMPWVIFFFLRLVMDNKHYIGLAVSLWLTFLAHSVIAYYAVLLMLLTYVIVMLYAVFFLKKSSVWFYSRNKLLILSAVLFFVLCSPWLFALYVFSDEYDMARILQGGFLPAEQFKDWVRYFWDNYFRFGVAWEGYTIQMDVALWTSAIVIGIWLFVLKKINPVVIALAVFLLLALILQLPVTAPFYEHFPGAAYIQFPWRLLAIVTPVLIMLVFIGGDLVLPKPHLVLLPVTVITLFTSGALITPSYGRFTAAEIEGARHNIGTITGVYSASAEYVNQRVPLEWLSTLANIQKPAALYTPIQAIATAKGCAIEFLASQEWLSREFTILCERDTVSPLPLMYSNDWQIVADSGELHCMEVNEAPGICAVPLSVGKNKLSVRVPNFIDLVF